MATTMPKDGEADREAGDPLLFFRGKVRLTGMAEQQVQSDEELMQRYQEGSAAAFDELYEKYRRPLYGFLVNHSGRSRQEVDEVFQETWLKLVRNRKRFDSSQLFGPWLFTIARNCLVDRWRHLGRISSLHVSDDIAMQGASSSGLARPDRQAESASLGSAWQAALLALPAEQREVILLKFETDMTLDEMGEVIGAGRETVKSRLRYAMAKLRKSLHEWQEELLDE